MAELVFNIITYALAFGMGYLFTKPVCDCTKKGGPRE